MTTKVAIVTGAAQGIGKAITKALLEEGHKVGILDLKEAVGNQTVKEFASQFGPRKCVFFKCDVTSRNQLQECYDRVEQTLGTVQVLVNNAGISDEINWNKMLDVNASSVIDMTFIGVQRMRQDKGGKGGTIINIASAAGLGLSEGYPVYGASKWAVVGFTMNMAASLALAKRDWGISLSCLCPGFVDSSMLSLFGKAGLDAMRVSQNTPIDECRKYIKASVDRGTVCSLEDAAAAFKTLLKDNKNGSVLRVYKTPKGLIINRYVELQWKKANI